MVKLFGMFKVCLETPLKGNHTNKSLIILGTKNIYEEQKILN